jgi:hypothetical protein
MTSQPASRPRTRLRPTRPRPPRRQADTHRRNLGRHGARSALHRADPSGHARRRGSDQAQPGVPEVRREPVVFRGEPDLPGRRITGPAGPVMRAGRRPGNGGSGPARCSRSGPVSMTAIQSRSAPASRCSAIAARSAAAMCCVPTDAGSGQPSGSIRGPSPRRAAAYSRSSLASRRIPLWLARATGRRLSVCAAASASRSRPDCQYFLSSAAPGHNRSAVSRSMSSQVFEPSSAGLVQIANSYSCSVMMYPAASYSTWSPHADQGLVGSTSSRPDGGPGSTSAPYWLMSRSSFPLGPGRSRVRPLPALGAAWPYSLPLARVMGPGCCHEKGTAWRHE